MSNPETALDQRRASKTTVRCEIVDLYFWLGEEAERVGFTPWQTVWLAPPTPIYDVADDPLFGRPACLIFKNDLCVTNCEYGIAGDCPRRLAEEREDDE